LNYGEAGRLNFRMRLATYFQRQVQIRSSALSCPDCARSVKRRAIR